MKQRLIVQSTDGQVLYQGRPLDLPIKREAIIKKSIELFSDDDPCIIHKSYVIKLYVDELLEELKNSHTIILSEKHDFLALPMNATLRLGE